uniref:ribonuclease H n=1 Tax=Oreochromis niloticus TaxID=8128 RepID=A0A669DQG9_ORENI
MGNVRLRKNNRNTSFVLEPHEQYKLPGGLLLESALVDIPFNFSSKVPVIVHNVSEHAVTLQSNSIVAQACAAQHVSPLASSQTRNPPSRNEPDSDNLTFNRDDSPIPEQWKERILGKLRSIPEVFALDDMSHGHTTAVKHQIKLNNEAPFKERPRPIHPSDREAVKQHLRELLDAGIIRESQSPFASPFVLVRKKNGSIRLCIDYRKLNLRTIRDAYALPNIEETFTALSGAKWFSVMDLKSGYYQVEVAEEDKPKTAFVCPLGFYEFNRMPQGVTNAPSTFQRLMEKCVGDLHLTEVLVFLDDLIVFSDTLEEHESRLMKVLTRLRDYGLKLSPEKCHFFKTSVKYLGHVVDAHGVHTDPEKISALKIWPRPSNFKELKCFLGFAGYYRRFVEGYSKIAKPWNRLTACYRPPKKRGKIYKREPPRLSYSPTQPLGEQWTHECETFRTIIEKLISAPILAFANPQLPYVLHTDACRDGLGAALYQEQEGRLRAIAYASRGLSKSEQNYPTHKLEFLALKWAVCEKFNDYLYGSSFTVLTDNNPLTYVLTTTKLDAAGHRWLAALSTYNFNIKYRAGQANKDADGLSRRPQEPPHEDEAFVKEKARIDDMKERLINMANNLDHETFSALCQRHSVSCHSEPLSVVESLAIDPSSVTEAYGEDILPSMTDADWRAAQKDDPSLALVKSPVGKRLETQPQRNKS